ncbi:MAG: hypothetical protein DRO46_01720 [Candidatus Hecatellales archaeon]|nr:MAG: hypothetical protein DRO46_01720 [Candidatus Hecatellales archaeon]
MEAPAVARITTLGLTVELYAHLSRALSLSGQVRRSLPTAAWRGCSAAGLGLPSSVALENAS